MGAFGRFRRATSAGVSVVSAGAIAACATADSLAGFAATAPLLRNAAAPGPCAAPIQRRRLGAPELQRPNHAGPGYAGALATTALGWPVLPHWCVWIEPVAASVSGEPASGAAREQTRWQEAVEAALAAWQPLLPIQVVTDEAAAQVRIWRRRPPLRTGADGRSRASHGRAMLQLLAVERQPGRWRLEPAVTVLISPGQRREALQATAVHELGHAFGLWGHSPDPADALAAAPGAVPVLVPSARDRATLSWLRRQPTRFGTYLAVPPSPDAPRAGGSAGALTGEEAAAAGEGQGDKEAEQLHRHHSGT